MRTKTKLAAVALLAAVAIHYGPQTAIDDEPNLPAKGLMVLVVEETADRAKLPSEQVTIFTSAAVREYLDQKCAKDADGHPLWRFVDDDIEADTLPTPLRAAFEKQRAGLPWLGISNGRKGREGPLPENVEATLKLLKKYGGA